MANNPKQDEEFSFHGPQKRGRWGAGGEREEGSGETTIPYRGYVRSQ